VKVIGEKGVRITPDVMATEAGMAAARHRHFMLLNLFAIGLTCRPDGRRHR